MADTKISALTAVVTVAGNQEILINDVNDTTMAASGTDKSMTITQLLDAITGDVTFAGLAATVGKTGGVAFAASATTNTTNAANITSGIIPAARLPTGIPSAESSNRALVAGDNGHTLVCTGTPTFTVNTGLGLGFGCAFTGNPSFTGTATVTDQRVAAANPTSALVCTATDTYIVVGTS